MNIVNVNFASINIQDAHNEVDELTIVYQKLLLEHKNKVDQYIVALTSVLLLGGISKPYIEARLAFAVRAIFDSSGMYPRRILDFIFVFKQIFCISDGIKLNLTETYKYIPFSDLSEIEKEVVLETFINIYKFRKNSEAFIEIRKFISVFPNLMIFEVSCLFCLYKNRIIKISTERIIERRDLKAKLRGLAQPSPSYVICKK